MGPDLENETLVNNSVILQWVIMKMGWMLSVTLGTTAAESLSAAANVFLGQVNGSYGAGLVLRSCLLGH